MKDIKIAATQSSPEVHTSFEDGILEMCGDSYPENSFEFFNPILSWTQDFLMETQKSLKLKLHLVYLNTSSVKAMMELFDLLESWHANGRDIAVTWTYSAENERISELAEEFHEDCTFPFDIIKQD